MMFQIFYKDIAVLFPQFLNFFNKHGFLFASEQPFLIWGDEVILFIYNATKVSVFISFIVIIDNP